MNTGQTVSLRNAIFININIMLGIGIFINTVVLAKQMGWIGGLLYLAVGFLMLPLVLSMVALLRLHPGGNFYTFGAKEMGSFAGFINTWGFFSAKLASSALMIHIPVLLIQELIPPCALVSPYIIDFFILSIFIGLNLLDVKTGGAIQTAFLGFKLIPMLFTILGGIFLFHGSYLSLDHIRWKGILNGFPLLVYTATGFESAVSLSSKIENSEKNAPQAILYSYAIVMGIAALFQVIFFGAIGPALETAIDYRAAFPSLIALMSPANSLLTHKILAVLYLAIASSALGGSYGLIFSNSWNLYSLAQHNHLFFSKLFTSLNKYQIPWACILAEGVLCFFYLAATRGAQVPLQQLAVLGSTVTYTFCALALLIAKLRKPYLAVSLWTPILGLASCSLLLATCMKAFFIEGMTAFFAFLVILLLGSWMFYRKNAAHANQ